MTSRFVAVEGSVEAFEAAARELAPVRPWAVTVDDAHSATEALLAAVAGRSLLIHAVAARDVLDRLYDDLRRLAVVEIRTDDTAAGSATDGVAALAALGEDELALLRLLAAGLTLREAAAELHLSPRTADRRLARARAALGARTTAEAIVALGR